MSTTRVEQTVHGDVKYETFTCSGCDSEAIVGTEHDLYDLNIKHRYDDDEDVVFRVGPHYTLFQFCEVCQNQPGPTARLALQKANYKRRLQGKYTAWATLLLIAEALFIWWAFL
ncbi:hypothetical protein HUG10_20535 (plasmid) [Halorarum halophilum]|uniref:Uncharacterized protein n=1 Tax=Halorarum halophilum TaxID=2743090 RepID=A0A7D5KIG1_9EURY|nr:hypothetical protein [Halobaculum halophilum]QLG29996.1 hypothetical protein HUG10_20535 [Halobaculum halophilum]